MKIYPKIYKQDSKGKIRVYQISVEKPDGPKCMMVMHSGILGGAIVESVKLHEDSKLKTAFEKAVTEANKKYRKKKESGYVEKLEDAKSPVQSIIYKPVLLSRYEKEKHRITFPCSFTPKLDGLRATWRSPWIWTRGLKHHEQGALNHIYAALSHPQLNNLYFDGELYAEGVMLQDLTSATRVYDPEISPRICLYIFDIPMENEYSYKQRLQMLINLKQKMGGQWPDCLKIMKQHIVHDHDEIDRLYNDYVGEGYEGAVVRNLDEPYSWDKRSKTILKVKPVYSSEFEVTEVRFNSVTGTPLVEFECVTNDGVFFEVVPSWPHDQREAQSRTNREWDDMLGKMMTCEYRGWTKDGRPVHCVAKAIREKGI